MTTPTDSAPEGKELQAPPVPDVSAPSEAKPSSTGTVNIDALVSQINELSNKFETLPETIERLVQSKQDRRLGKYDQLGDLQPLLDFKTHLDKRGGNWDQAMGDYELAQLKEMVMNQAASAQPVPGRTESAEQAKQRRAEKAGEVLRKAGIAFNDPEVKALASQNFETELAFEIELLALAARREKAAQPLNPGTLLSEGGNAPPPADIDGVIEQINAIKQIPGYRDNPTLMKRRKALLDQLKILDPPK